MEGCTLLINSNQGSKNWVGLLGDQLMDPHLRREIVKYGEFAQATYDAFDFEPHSKYCGSCRYGPQKLFDKVGLYNTGYTITKYLYAMSDIHLPKWFCRQDSENENTAWSKDSNWMGYIAVSTDEELKRLGRRDIVVAWRGTVTQLEWLEDLKDILQPLGEVGSLHENSSVKVERGFLSIYTSKNRNTRYNKLSASEQAMKELGRLVDVYTQKGEDVSITITGHSLGGALALLSAYEVAAKGLNSHKADPDRTVPVTVFSFGAPRVGNGFFKDRLGALGVKVLRVVSKRDIVPKTPGIVVRYTQLATPIYNSLVAVYTKMETQMNIKCIDSVDFSLMVQIACFSSAGTGEPPYVGSTHPGPNVPTADLVLQGNATHATTWTNLGSMGDRDLSDARYSHPIRSGKLNTRVFFQSALTTSTNNFSQFQYDYLSDDSFQD